MYQYILLLAIPVIISLMCNFGNEQIYAEQIIKKQKNPLLIAFFICFFLLLVLRHESIGRDLANYKYYFEKYSLQSYSEYPMFSKEWLFKWLNIFIGNFTDNYQIYLAVVAGLILLPIAIL